MHLKFFRGCWPALLNASSALRDATVMVHVLRLVACNARVPTGWHSAARMLPTSSSSRAARSATVMFAFRAHPSSPDWTELNLQVRYTPSA